MSNRLARRAGESLGSTTKVIAARVATNGRVAGHWANSDLAVSSTVHRSGLHLEAHAHRSATLNVVTHGLVRERIAGRRFEGGPGSLVFKPPEEEHENWYGAEPATSVLIEFSPGGRYHRLFDLDRGPGPDSATPMPRTLALAGLLLAELGATDQANGLHLEGLAISLAGEIGILGSRGSSSGATPSWLGPTRDRLADHASSPPSIGELAEAEGVHPASLCRAFLRVYGESPGQFVRRLRLDRAAGDLADLNRTISSVAHRHGFSDHAHLSRQFKVRFGVTPSIWRGLLGSAEAELGLGQAEASQAYQS